MSIFSPKSRAIRRAKRKIRKYENELTDRITESWGVPDELVKYPPLIRQRARDNRTPESRNSQAGLVALASTPRGVLWRNATDPNQLELPLDNLDEADHDLRRDTANRTLPDGIRPKRASVPDDASIRTESDLVRKALAETTIPTEKLRMLQTDLITDRNLHTTDGRRAGGFVTGLLNSKDPFVAIDIPESNQVEPRIIAHELGHVAEIRAKATSRDLPRVGHHGDRENARGRPSAGGEGFADGVSLRFGYALSRPPHSVDDEDHRSIDARQFGYTTGAWDSPENKASYTAHRTLAWETGMLPRGPEGHFTNSREEAVHRAGATSAQVRRAMRIAGLTDTAKAMSEQFMATRKQGTQLSLLGKDYEYDVYDAPKVDWDAE